MSLVTQATVSQRLTFCFHCQPVVELDLRVSVRTILFRWMCPLVQIDTLFPVLRETMKMFGRNSWKN